MFTASQRLKNKTYELRPVRVQWSYLCYNSQSRPGSDNGPMLFPVENVSVAVYPRKYMCASCLVDDFVQEALQKFEISNYAFD